GVVAVSLTIGVCMRLLFPDAESARQVPMAMVEEDTDRTTRQLFLFFAILVCIMLTSTGIFDRPAVRLGQQLGLIDAPVRQQAGDPDSGSASRTGNPEIGSTSERLAGATSVEANLALPVLAKFLMLGLELAILMLMLKRWFLREEIVGWLKKSWSLFLSIFPMVLIGLFVSGVLAALLPMLKFMTWFRDNTPASNILVSFIGAMSYFGTIVGVNIVATMNHFGMHIGPCLALLLSGPAVSLPSVLALVPIVGSRKAATYLILVVVCSALTGYIYGTLQ
ncbi:MAG TPA: permease, partial [Candidatus Ozemobacteraceae bacterium]|nr:permease [Candidatus Ozemobacteraceae bacterium]